MKKPMVYYALRYAERGFAVFPLREGGKEPLTKNGCKDATQDPQQIQQWWKRWPKANLAIATGSTSGGLVVVDIDIDTEKGVYGNESLRLWESEFSPLPDTLTAITGRGGTHYYFRSDQDIRNRAGVLEGVDIRGEGGYVVAPPSLHPNGTRYEWEASSTSEPAKLTEDLLALVRPAGGSGQRFQMPEAVSSGARNDTLFRLAASLQERGLTDAAIYSAVQAENQAKCIPPLSEREVQQLINSALRYQKGDDPAQARYAAEIAAQGESVELLTEETMASVWAIKDIVERQSVLAKFRERARKLRILKDFNAMWSAFQRREIQRKKGDGGNLIQFTDCPAPGLKCGDWVCDDLGVRRFKPSQNDPDGGFWEQACPHPILPVERLTNADTDQEKLRIAFAKDSVWRTLVAERSVTASNQRIVVLADRGIQIISKEGSALTEYLRDMETINMDKLPQLRSINRFGWVHSSQGLEFSPYTPDLRYDGEGGEEEDFFGSIGQAGSRNEWLKLISVVRQSSIQARVMLAASFASPLVEILGKLPFVVHIWGVSGAGKTVSQMAAASVWGNPAPGKYLRSLNNTKVGVEMLASLCCSTPLILDELQTINSEKKYRKNGFDDLVYLLCSGQGRGRGSAKGGMRQVGKWRLCTITSGEQPLSSASSGAGAINRVIDLNCPGNLFKDGTAGKIAEGLAGNYGFAGKEWIEIIKKADIQAEAKEKYQTAYSSLVAQGISEKQALAGSLCVVADALADQYIFRDGLAVTEAEIAPLLVSEKAMDPAERVWQWVVSLLAANPQHFQSEGYAELWGERRETSEGVEYWVNAQILRKEMENDGLSYRASLAALSRAGRIEQRCGKNTINHKLQGVQTKCVHLVLQSAEDEFSPDDYEEI